MTWLWAVIHHGQSHRIVVGIHDLVGLTVRYIMGQSRAIVVGIQC